MPAGMCSDRYTWRAHMCVFARYAYLSMEENGSISHDPKVLQICTIWDVVVLTQWQEGETGLRG